MTPSAIPEHRTLQLEPTNVCNARCIMCCVDAACQSGFRGRAGQGFMPGTDLLRLLGEFRDLPAGKKEITLPWAGEATIHPDFNEMMKFLLAGDFCDISLVTNGLGITAEVADLLLEHSVFRRHRFNILFSLDAASEETYQRVKGRQGFHQVVQNITRLLSRRESAILRQPTLLLQFLLMDENMDDISGFRYLAEEIFQSIDYYEALEHQGIDTSRDGIHYRIIGHTGNSMTRDRNHLRQVLGLPPGDVPDGEFDLRPCAYPTENLNIHWSGAATVCCNDLGLLMCVGQWPDASLAELYESPRGEVIRRKHREKKRADLTLCRDCVVYRPLP